MKRRTINTISALATALLLPATALAEHELTKPIAKPDLVFEGVDGFVAVEAEHFFKQEKADVRAWYITTADKEAGLKPDADPNKRVAEIANAGGGQTFYVQVTAEGAGVENNYNIDINVLSAN